MTTTLPAPRPDARTGSVVGALRAGLRGSPGRLRVAATLAVLAALLAGAGTAAALRERSAALDTAAAASAQLLLLQQVRSDLLRADALATTGFLRPGEEPRAEREAYAAAIDAAARGLATAALAEGGAGTVTGSGDADAAAARAAYERATAGVQRYAGRVEQARVNKREGRLVAADWLDRASSQVRADDGPLPALTELTGVTALRADAALARADRARWGLLAAAVLGLGGLVVAQGWLAVRTRRRVNLPAAPATLVLAAAVAAGVAAFAAAGTAAAEVRAGAAERARDLGSARAAAFDARASEGLRLVRHGNGAAAEAAWVASAEQVRAGLADQPADVREPFEAYARAHAAIAAADDAGDWTGAVRAALATGDSSAAAAFERFDAASAAALEDAAGATGSGLREAGSGLWGPGVAAFVVGLLAALAVGRGFGQRLAEYR